MSDNIHDLAHGNQCNPKKSDEYLSEILRQLLQAEGNQHRAEGTGKADDD